MTANQQKVLDLVSEMSVLELSQLVKAMEEKFGVSAAAVAVAGPAAAGPVVEEKTEFTVELLEAGATKIDVIKAVKTITNLGLAEAKALVDGAPKVIKEGVNKADAEKMKKDLEAVGAKVALK